MKKANTHTGFSKLVYAVFLTLLAFILAISLSILALITYQNNHIADVFKPKPPRPATPVLVIPEPANGIRNGVDIGTGLIAEDGWEMVRANCTACHSAKLITQNRQTRDGWKEVIAWMQETQGLWDLGKNEDLILDYLAKNYAPEAKGRRARLKNIQWYVLKESKNR